MAETKGFKSGAGLNLTLQILAVLDLLPGIAIFAASLTLGGPGPSVPQPDINLFGIASLLLFLQILLRCIALVVMSRWTWRLVFNAQKQARFPISPRWAWLGWFIPLVGLVLPVRSLLALNDGPGGIAGWRRLLILAWWIIRLGTCFSGGFAILFSASSYLIFRFHAFSGDGSAFAAIDLFWLSLTGMAAKVLELAVVTLTYRHQPKAGEILASTVF